MWKSEPIMILTGSKIKQEYQEGNIVLDPYDEAMINPNSVDYRLGPSLKKFDYFDGKKSYFKDIEFPKEGVVLEPHEMYLGHTLEVIGSKKYAMSLIGRSSIGRLGLFLQVSADLLHTTSEHQVTLEIVATKPIRIYPNMIIGQVSFWKNCGDVVVSPKTYALLNGAQESRQADKIAQERGEK